MDNSPFEMRKVVDRDIATQAAMLRERIELNSRQLTQRKLRGARPSRELGRADEAVILVRATRDEFHDVLGADDGQEK